MPIAPTLKKTMTHRFVALVATAAAMTVAPQAQADATYSPTLTPGDKFHLVFVTDGTRDALSSNIEDYNTFVQAQAELGGLDTIFGQSITWKAIGSTATVDARDNIGDIAAPIFRTDGALVATYEADLFDSTLLKPIIIDQHQTTIPTPGDGVWNGSKPDGVRWVGIELGSPQAVFGAPEGTLSDWIVFRADETTNKKRFYTISSEITFVPEPASAAMFAVSLGVLTLRRRRRSA